MSGCESVVPLSIKEVGTMSWYAVPLTDMQLHWFHIMHSTELTDYCANVYPSNRKLCNCIPNCTTVYPNIQAGKSYKRLRQNCIWWCCDNLLYICTHSYMRYMMPSIVLELVFLRTGTNSSIHLVLHTFEMTFIKCPVKHFTLKLWNWFTIS